MGDEYSYWLSSLRGVGSAVKRRLAAAAGGARALYGMGEGELMAIEGVSEKLARLICESKGKNFAEALSRIGERGIDFISIEDGSYPPMLRAVPDAPYGLYAKGRLPGEGQRCVAIVGARGCSEYGRAMAKKIGAALSKNGVWVVSGLAYGIDAAGHAGAVSAGGLTCAVLGCGVDVCYPEANRALLCDILKTGSAISEYPPGTSPRPGFFPQRNRIIAGMCEAVVVVEARERSGSLITADQALEQGRDVYAVPGRVTDDLSRGCNCLIRQGAGIISGVDEFLLELGISPENAPVQADMKNLLLEKDESMVYSCVDLRPRGIEELLDKTGIPLPALIGILSRLEQRGYVAETFKNRYVRRE